MNLFDIAVRNIKKNLSNYFLYFISMVCSIMIFYTLKSIQYNKQIMDLSNLNEKIENAFSSMSIVIALFAFVFIWYSNIFFIGKRKKEIALYCLMGVKKKQAARMLFYENLVMGFMALIAGLLFGIMFSKLFSMILVSLMELDIKVAITIPLEAIISTIGVFLGLFVFTSLHGYMIIYKYQLIDLFKSESKAQKQPKVSLILTLISIFLIGSGYFRAAHFKYNGLKGILIILILTITGTYLLFSSLIVYTSRFVKKKKSIFFKGINIITFSHLIFRSKSNSRLLATIAILSACTITSVGAAAALYYDNVTGANKQMPFSYVYEIKDSNLDKKVEDVVSRHKENPIKDSIAVEVKSIEGEYPPIDKINPGKKEYEKTVDNVISLGTLKRILASMGKDTNIFLKQNEVMIYFYTMYSEDVMENPKGKTMYYGIDNKSVPFNIKDCINYPVINRLFNKSNSIINVVVVNDEVYAKLVGNTSPATLRLINIENPIKSKDTTDDVIKTIRQSRVYNQNSYGENALNISTYYDEYSNMMAELGMTIFLITFVGIVFLICTGSMIFFKQLSEANDDSNRYNILRKIGASRKEMRLSIAKQMSVIFGLPLVVGVSHSLVALKILKPLIKTNIWYPVFTVVAIYILIYFIYYLLTVKFYCRILDRSFTRV